MSARKIVQITASRDEADCSDVYALADDGTLWWGYWEDQRLHWRLLPPLPEPSAGEPAEAEGAGR